MCRTLTQTHTQTHALSSAVFVCEFVLDPKLLMYSNVSVVAAVLEQQPPLLAKHNAKAVNNSCSIVLGSVSQSN